MRLAADCSTTYSRPPTANEAALWKDLGLERMIIGTSFTPDRGHIAAWQSAGVDVQEYQFPQDAKGTPARPWWVDAENKAATREAMRSAMAEPRVIGPYTRRGFWLDVFGAWDFQAEFPGAQLWDARYIGTTEHGYPERGGEPCLIVRALNTGDAQRVRDAIAAEFAMLPPFRSYAGFDRAAITQWHNSITIYGINVDLDVLHDEPAPAPQEDDDMQPYLAWDKTRQRAYLIGPNGVAWITNAEDVTALEAKYGPMTIALTASAIDAIGAAW